MMGSIRSFIEVSHFFHLRKWKQREILSPNSYTNRERSVGDKIVESLDSLKLSVRSKGMRPVMSSYEFWKNGMHLDTGFYKLWRYGLAT